MTLTKTALPQRAMQNLADRMGVKDASLISDVKTNRVGETYYISVVLTQEIKQSELMELVK